MLQIAFLLQFCSTAFMFHEIVFLSHYYINEQRPPQKAVAKSPKTVVIDLWQRFFDRGICCRCLRPMATVYRVYGNVVKDQRSSMDCFVLQVIRGRWFMVFACLQIMAMAGVNYLFSLYSNDIKSSMGYDQATLNLVSVSKDLGCYVGIITSLISEIVPPWVVLSIGAAMNFFGYFMIWLAVTGHLKRVSLWQMRVYICIACNSQTFINTGTFVTCVKNFPKSRGVVTGLLMGNVGLSGAILTQLYHAFYYSNKSDYTLILLFAWLPTAVFIVFL